jgi:hypothetical protein
LCARSWQQQQQQQTIPHLASTVPLVAAATTTAAPQLPVLRQLLRQLALSCPAVLLLPLLCLFAS